MQAYILEGGCADPPMDASTRGVCYWRVGDASAVKGGERAMAEGALYDPDLAAPAINRRVMI